MSADFAGTDRYRVIRPIGRGGMGAVFEVEDRRDGSRVALKLMLGTDARRLLRFKQEFRVAAELHHPNLVRLLELGQHAGRWFFTMELIEGEELLALLLGRPTEDETFASVTIDAGVDLESAVAALAQVLDALEFLHARGIVHRDLKPGNILVDARGVVRVLDFGLVRQVEHGAQLSVDGALIGTLAYMAPEQCQGLPAGPPADLYAVGCLLFELLSGRRPHGGAPGDILRARLDAPAPRLDVPGVPPAVAAICEALLDRDPAARPSIGAVRQALGLGDGADSGVVIPERFVGRAAELDALGACLTAAAAGESCLALVRGPNGIGKSALARALAGRARAQGFLVLGGRCYPRERVPFMAFDRLVDALAVALQSWPSHRIQALATPLLQVSRAFPALALPLPGRSVETPETADPRSLAAAVFPAFVELIAQVQRYTPLLLCFDDMQWIDRESRALMEALLAGLTGRVMILVTLGGERERRAWPADVDLTLSPLAPAEAAELVAQVAGTRVDRRSQAKLAAQAAGDPFLTSRLAELIARLDPDARAARLTHADSAGSLLRELLVDLDPAERVLLVLTALARDAVAEALIRRASGLPSGQVDHALASLRERRLLVATEAHVTRRADGQRRFDLYHEQLREQILAGVPPEARRAHHRALAMALLELPGEAGRDPEALVHHWTAAGDVAQRARAALEAADAAEARLAFQHAAELLRIALEGAEATPETARTWARAARLHEWAGEFAQALDAFQTARGAWAECPPSEARTVAMISLRGVIGELLTLGGALAEGRAMYREALSELGLRPARWRWLQMVRIGVLEIRARSARAGRTRPLTTLDRARLDVLDRMHRALLPLWPLDAIEAGLRAELLALRCGDDVILQHARAARAILPAMLGQTRERALAAAHHRADRAERAAHAARVPLARERGLLYRAALWASTAPDRARACSVAAREALAAKGMTDAFEGTLARGLGIFVRFVHADWDAVLDDTAYELRRDDNINLVLYARALRCAIHAGRGQPEAREELAAIEARSAGLPLTRLAICQVFATLATRLAEGDFAAVLALAPRWRALRRAVAEPRFGMLGSMAADYLLDAAVGLARQGTLPGSRRRWALRYARASIRRGGTEAIVGLRAHAQLYALAGQHRRARAALARVLLLSASPAASPHRRWQCLEAARDLGYITSEQAAEADDLHARHGFRLPRGWRGSDERRDEDG